MSEVTLALGGVTLARLRAIQGQLAELERQRTEVLTIALEGAGHDASGLAVTALDLDVGQVTAAPRASP